MIQKQAVTHIHTYMHTYRKTDIQTDRQTDKHMNTSESADGNNSSTGTHNLRGTGNVPRLA